MTLIQFILSLSLIDWILIGVGLLSFIPASVLIRYYRKSGVLDYLLFAGVFLLVPINQTFAVIRSNIPSNAFVYQIMHSAFILGYLLLFFHAIRIKWDLAPTLVRNISVIWFSIMQFVILFYEVVNLPDKAIVLFMEMRKVKEVGIPINVAIITQGGIVLLAPGYFFLGHLYRIFVLIVCAYAYLTTEHVIIDKRIQTARNLWLLAIGVHLIDPILYLGDLFSLWTTIYVLHILANFCTLIIITYIVFQYPEAVLLSKVQIIRAFNLYKSVLNLESEKQFKELGMDSLVQYLRRIPSDLLDRQE